MTPEIECIETEDRAVHRAIADAIDAFNAGRTGLGEPDRPLMLAIRDPGTGAVVGGLQGISYYRWLFVENLVLPQALRGRGLGTQLIARAEAVARARGCIGVWLDTFSFQARGFYEKLGYRVFGQIDDYPPGHCRFYLSKRLDARPAVPG